MSRIYNEIWCQGSFKNLPPGHHYQQQYKNRVASLVVPAGEQVTFYKNPDRSGGQSSYIFFEGTYQDLSWYGVKSHPGMIHVEKTEVTANDLVEIGYYGNYEDGGKKHSFYMHHKLPIGEYFAPDHFWNDKISHLQIPFGVCCEVFEDKDNPKSLIFDGVDEGGRTHIGLPDYDYGWLVSRIKITADTWESAGTKLENVEVESDEITADVFELANNSDIDGAVIKDVIGYAKEKTTGIEWNAAVAISAFGQFQFGPENCQGTVGGSVEVSAGYGENETNTKSDTRSVEVESPPMPAHSTINGSLLVERGIMTGDIVRKWRNTRTGATTRTRGRFRTTESGQKTRAEFH